MSTFAISGGVLPGMFRPGTEIHYPGGEVVTIGEYKAPNLTAVKSVEWSAEVEILTFHFDDGNDTAHRVPLSVRWTKPPEPSGVPG